MVDALGACSTWRRVNPMVQRHDFFFRSVRLTRVWHDDTPEEASEPCAPMRKDRIACANVALGGDLLVRIAASSERPIALRSEETGQAYEMDAPDFVRVKQTQSWETSNGWRFDASRVWHASTLSAALAAIESTPPLYELELEVISNEYVAQHSDAHVADSLVMKLRDLCVTSDGRVLAEAQSS